MTLPRSSLHCTFDSPDGGCGQRAVTRPSSYVVGRALTSTPSFIGADTEYYDNYICDLQGKVGQQCYDISPA